MNNVQIHTSDRTIIFSLENDSILLMAKVEQLELEIPVAGYFNKAGEVKIDKEIASELVYQFNVKYSKEKVGFLRKRANKKEIEFNLDFNDLFRMNNIQRCELTGIKLTKSTSNGALKFNASTLDRVDHNKGYVKGNVIVMCHAANKLKARFEDPNHSDYNKYSPEELLQFLRDHFHKAWQKNPEYYI